MTFKQERVKRAAIALKLHSRWCIDQLSATSPEHSSDAPSAVEEEEKVWRSEGKDYVASPQAVDAEEG
jgi:hypothetical protein